MNLTTVFNTLPKTLKKAHTLEILLVTSATPYSLCVCVCVNVNIYKYIHMYINTCIHFTHMYICTMMYITTRREVLTTKIGKIRSCIRF